MKLLVVNSIWEFFGGAILVVFLLYYVFMFFAFLSKITKTGMSFRGGGKINSNDFDNNIKFWKKNIQNLINKINNYKIRNEINPEKKIILLSMLNEMYNKGEITKKEYDNLKNKILN
jgi:hypothetical protein